MPATHTSSSRSKGRISDLWPDLMHRPGRGDMRLKVIKPGSQVLRIFDAKKATALGYKPFDFNPTVLKDYPSERGRYSSARQRPREEWYSYLYVAEHTTDERVALLECIDILGLSRFPNGRRHIDLKMLQHLAFAYTQSARPLTLLDISSRPKVDVFKASFEVLQGHNYQLTRRWGRYFRSLNPDLDGFYYCPIRYGNTECGGNMVLFAPHNMQGDQLLTNGTVVPFDSPGGRARLVALEADTNTLIDW